MSEDDLIEGPKEAKIDAKVPKEPVEKGGSASLSRPKKDPGGISGIFAGISKIPKEGPGVPEDKNEPHTHLMLLLIIIVIIGVIVAFMGI